MWLATSRAIRRPRSEGRRRGAITSDDVDTAWHKAPVTVTLTAADTGVRASVRRRTRSSTRRGRPARPRRMTRRTSRCWPTAKRSSTARATSRATWRPTRRPRRRRSIRRRRRSPRLFRRRGRTRRLWVTLTAADQGPSGLFAVSYVIVASDGTPGRVGSTIRRTSRCSAMARSSCSQRRTSRERGVGVDDGGEGRSGGAVDQGQRAGWAGDRAGDGDAGRRRCGRVGRRYHDVRGDLARRLTGSDEDLRPGEQAGAAGRRVDPLPLDRHRWQPRDRPHQRHRARPSADAYADSRADADRNGDADHGAGGAERVVGVAGEPAARALWSADLAE